MLIWLILNKMIFDLIFQLKFFTNTAFFVWINSNQSVDKKRNQRWKLWFQNLLDSHVALEWNIIYYRHTFVYEEVIWWANHDSALLETLSIRAKKAKKYFTFKSFVADQTWWWLFLTSKFRLYVNYNLWRLQSFKQ